MEFLKKLGVMKLASIIGAAVIVLAFFVFLLFKMSSGVYTPLYANLSVEDAGVIAIRLQAMGIGYDTNAEGTEISVPSNKVLMLRMMFAQDGIPSSGNIVGYEIFDREDVFGTSQFVYNINLIRALEGELVRTISSLNQVEDVRVHIALPKKELFSRTHAAPSASIVLKMRGNLALSKSEITAIANLVATAVPGLSIEHITIVDSLGRPLLLGAEDDDNLAALASNAMELQINIEKRLKQEIESLVSRLVGLDKVTANVTVDMSFDREIINSEVYDPNGQVIRSQKQSSDSEHDTEPMRPVSVATNLPGQAAPPTPPPATKNLSRSDEIVNYEISKTVSNKVVDNAKIKTLSIAVLVDGTYVLDKKTKQQVYTPRSAAELAQIKSLIISGLGINLSRGDQIEIINMPFVNELGGQDEDQGILGFVKDDLQNIVQTVVIGIVLVLLVLMVIRPLILRSMERLAAVPAADATQDMINNLQQEVQMAGVNNPSISPMSPGHINSHAVDEEKASAFKEFNELVDNHSEETVATIKNWLYQD